MRVVFPFIFVQLLVFAVGDKEELHHGRETFEQRHMNMGKHNEEMDHKAILGGIDRSNYHSQKDNL